MFLNLDLGVELGNIKGLIESVKKAPLGDFWPRSGVMGIGGMVKYTEEGKPVEIKVRKIGSGVGVGDPVWVNKVVKME